MSMAIKTVIWFMLAMSAVAIWFYCMILNLMITFSKFTDFAFITPIVAFTSVVCIIHMMVRVNQSCPLNYIIAKYKVLRGKAKI